MSDEWSLVNNSSPLLVIQKDKNDNSESKLYYFITKCNGYRLGTGMNMEFCVNILYMCFDSVKCNKSSAAIIL